jgi:transposase
MSDDQYEGLLATFAATCRKGDAARRKQRSDPHTEFLRTLLEDDVSLERAWDEINRDARKRYNAAPQATVAALMYSLRERGVAALKEPATQRRLSELSEQQVDEVGSRLQQLKPEAHARAEQAAATELAAAKARRPYDPNYERALAQQVEEFRRKHPPEARVAAAAVARAWTPDEVKQLLQLWRVATREPSKVG